MKRIIPSRPLSLIVASASLLAAHHATAQSQASRFYVKADMGGSLMPNTRMTEYFGPIPANTTVKFDPGFRFGLVGGYAVTDWFAAELETGYMGNNIKSITGADQVDAVYSNFPLLANVRLQLPGDHRIVPYIGGGLGGSISVIDADPITLNNITMFGTAGGATFAYQGFAGVTCKINDRMAVGLEYHYFATAGASMQADFVSAGIPSDTIKFASTATHTISLVFNFTF